MKWNKRIGRYKEFTKIQHAPNDRGSQGASGKAIVESTETRSDLSRMTME